MAMMYREIQQAEDVLFDAFATQHSSRSLWQSSHWKQYEEQCGRTVRRFAGWRDATMCITAQISVDRTFGGYATWTMQRGPLWDSSLEISDILRFIQFLSAEAKKDRAMSMFLSPALWDPLDALPGKPSQRHIVPQATVMIDLTQSEEEMMKAMHPKGRYNINIAKRDGVTVEESNDIDAFYALLTETSGRDGFAIKSKREYEHFLSIPGAFLLQALHPTQKKPALRRPIAGLIGVLWGGQAIYYYGASDYASRALMAPYALQWAAMQRAKAAGCSAYDLLGVSPTDALKNDPWQGITEFKKKFGGTVIEYPPEREIVLKPMARMMVKLKRKILG